MAGYGHRKDRKALEIIHIIVIANIFNCISTCSGSVESHGQAFIQTENQLRYTGDDGVVHVMHGKNIEISRPDGMLPTNSIRFEPPFLDFNEKPMGMPHLEQVTVINADAHQSLHLLSISGSTSHFHCSFFQDKMVSPGGNTTFDVVFLAREVGNVENTLYIHTSQGSFKYQVFGVGVPNPYRVRPFLGAKVPVNSSFSPLIHMHNPHSSTLQVLEMFSSGGDLHLELPTGEKEAPKNLWEIPPYETKPVMRASFIGRIESNLTAFIRIKTNREKKNQVLILPVEVQVTSDPGLFSPLEMIDFGILRTLDEPKIVRLNLLNSGLKSVHVTSITTSPPNDAIHIEFRPVKLQPDIMQPAPVALISFTTSKAVHPSQWSGKIVIKTKNSSHKLVIPYQANVLHGSLTYVRNKTLFYNNHKQHQLENVTRDIPLTNTFNFTLVIYNVSLPKEFTSYFSIQNFTSPVMLKPQQTLSFFKLKFHPNSTGIHLQTEMQVFTNASMFNIPVIVYNGKLKVVHHRPEIFKGQLDFGTMGVKEKRSMTFTIRNENPVDIIIREFGANMNNTLVDFLGVEKGNGTMLTRKHNTSEIDTNPLVLKPYHYAVFSCDLVAPSKEGSFLAEVIIVSQFEYLYIPITLRTAEGSLTADPVKVVFEKCFPGKVPYEELKIHSSFENYMEVRDVTFQPNDTRFYFRAREKPNLLHPHEASVIGRIYFDPKKQCIDDCYVGLPTYIPAGHQWLLGATLEKEVADTDQYLYTRFQQKWDLLGLQQTSTINVTIQLDTNQVRGFLFPAQAHLHWPSLTKKYKIKFPLTQISNMSISDFIVENPADVPVMMQILPLSLYPNPQTIIDMVSPHLSADLSEYIEMDDLDVFTLQDLEQFNSSPRNPSAGFRKNIENQLGVKSHKNTLAMILHGKAKYRVRVGFQPKDDLPRTSLILIRNNLTIIDTVVVQGQGGNGELRFGNRKPGSAVPFHLEMTEKHLKSCDKKKQSKVTPPSFTVKRTFTARNTGELPFYVHGFGISDAMCEGYGFKVLECQGFELLPNTSKKVDIAFTPDFTMSRIRRTLSMYTSLGPPLNYTLQATVPSHMLSRCAAALPRPSWEPILYYSTICIMGFLLFCTLVASYFEADRIVTDDVIKRRSKLISAAVYEKEKGKVFDLKSIGTRCSPVPEHRPPLHRTITPPVVLNGHIENIAPRLVVKEPSQTSSKSIVSIIITYMRRLFSSKKSQQNHVHPPKIERQHSQDTEANKLNGTTSVKGNGAIEKTSTSPLENNGIGSNKTPLYTNAKIKNKQAKAAKRQHPPDLLEPTCNGYANDKRQNNQSVTTNGIAMTATKNMTLNGRKCPESDNKINLEKEKSSTKLPVSRSSSIDLNDPAEVTLVTEDTDKKEVKKATKLRKSKFALKQEIRERRLRERPKQPEMLQETDRDETSSTTTESSSLETDEKNSSARELSPEPVLPKTSKKMKTRSKNNGKKKTGDDMEECNDNGFVITSKSKAHKNIKVDPKNAYGGNIHKPSSIELPYTTKLEAATKNSELDDLTNPPPITEKGQKKNYKNKGSKGAASSSRTSLSLDTESTCSSDMGKDSPPVSVVWDMPKMSPPRDADLSEISLQTEYARKNVLGTSNDLLSPGGSRSSTYSSIVSNGDANNKIGKFTIGKFDATKKPYNMALDQKHPGAIGPKATNRQNQTMNNVKKSNPWSMNPSSPVTTDGLNVGTFGLQAIQETHQVQPPVNIPTSDAGYNNFGLQDGINQFGFPADFGQQPVSMMQRLQADRHRRRMEYQQKLINGATGEEWPGFDIQTDSLWDTPAPTTDAWSTITDSPPRAQPTGALWDSAMIPNSSSNWNHGTSIWGASAAGGPVPENSILDPNCGGIPTTPVENPAEAVVGNFDPFSTLGDIWKPSTSCPGNATWGFPRHDEDES